MIRSVSFNETGDITVSGQMGTDRVVRGVVLLTEEQAQEAERHGWQRFGKPMTETTPHLIAVRRK